MEHHNLYHPPLALTIISSISIGIAAIVALWIAVDIILRRGWRTMMGVMIPVYVVNALYLWPITLWVYIQHGRPPKPRPGVKAQPSCHAETHSNNQAEKTTVDETPKSCCSHKQPKESSCHKDEEQSQHCTSRSEESPEHQGCHKQAKTNEKDSSDLCTSRKDSSATSSDLEKAEEPQAHACHQHTDTRSTFAILTAAVCHCGAGCVLGDIIGEWLVYGTGATIAGRELYVAYLVDFAFAIAFGLVFQYFSIAPMTGDYSIKTLYRALKADFFSLLFFQIGLFGWMAIFQIAIFNWKLEMNTVTYWWMMQIGMFLGHWTGIPINWWLIKKGVKEPCC